MDPNQTLRDFLDACQAGDRKAAEKHGCRLVWHLFEGSDLPAVSTTVDEGEESFTLYRIGD